MSLHLDKRQRAMLREMGVRVWQPAEPVAEPVVAINIAASHADDTVCLLYTSDAADE